MRLSNYNYKVLDSFFAIFFHFLILQLPPDDDYDFDKNIKHTK